MIIDTLITLSCLLYGNISGHILAGILLILLPCKVIYNNIFV